MIFINLRTKSVLNVIDARMDSSRGAIGQKLVLVYRAGEIDRANRGKFGILVVNVWGFHTKHPVILQGGLGWIQASVTEC